MFKKFGTSIFLVLVILMSVFVAAGCEKVSAVRENCVKISNGLLSVREGDFAVVKERNDLLAFVNILSIDIDDLAKYNDNFFQSGSLVVFNIIEQNQDTANEIVSYSIENGTITIDVKTTKYGTDGELAGYHFILELTAKEASSLTDTVIMKNGVKLQVKNRGFERLYTLHEALRLSWITLDDIRQIAEYRISGTCPEETPDENIALKIKMAKLSELNMGIRRTNEYWPNEKLDADDVFITGYYGKYKDCYAVDLRAVDYIFIEGTEHSDNFDEGISIYYGFGPSILVWHKQ